MQRDSFVLQMKDGEFMYEKKIGEYIVKVVEPGERISTLRIAIGKWTYGQAPRSKQQSRRLKSVKNL